MIFQCHTYTEYILYIVTFTYIHRIAIFSDSNKQSLPYYVKHISFITSILYLCGDIQKLTNLPSTYIIVTRLLRQHYIVCYKIINKAIFIVLNYRCCLSWTCGS